VRLAQCVRSSGSALRPAAGNIVDARTADPPDRAHWGRGNSLIVRREHMARAVGIDLGTTNSVVAVLEGGDPKVIADAEGGQTSSAVVAVNKNDDSLVDEIAKRQAVTNTKNTVSSVKRHIGTDWTTELGDKKLTAPEVSARILQKLKHDAEDDLQVEVSGAVITVPASVNAA